MTQRNDDYYKFTGSEEKEIITDELQHLILFSVKNNKDRQRRWAVDPLHRTRTE